MHSHSNSETEQCGPQQYRNDQKGDDTPGVELDQEGRLVAESLMGDTTAVQVGGRLNMFGCR